MRGVGKREDVVGADLPLLLRLLEELLVGVARRRAVEGVDGAVEVHVVDELVEVASELPSELPAEDERDAW